MTAKIAQRLTRAKLYFDRVCEDMRRGDAVQAMADSAELGHQARALYKLFREFHMEQYNQRQENEQRQPPDLQPD